ncbi:MAG: hypothetical protein DRI86_13185 [Bacteroidetes bacterium]|nr:MAG: hypothetical protein DRI86_13185 [Bacteroidota bacterium]
MKIKSKFVWSQLIKYFGQGLLFVVPIFATFAVLYYLFQKLDTLLNLDIPGLGLVIIIGGVTIVGFVGTRLVTTPAFKGIDRLINRAPIVKIIYSSVKDLLEAFVGSKKKFTEPVIIKINNDSDVSQIGFLTQTDLTDLGIKEGFVSVYVPFSYSIMGNVYVVPRVNVKKLDSSPTETMKFVVSGGITNVKEQRKEKEIK